MELKTIFILAGNYNEFKSFRRENPGLAGADLRYADSPEKLMGWRGAEYRTYGTFYQREDAHQIEDAAKRYLTQ
jgi:hypothetical protein